MGRRLQTNNKLLSCTEQTARHANASLQLQKGPITSPINSRVFQGSPKCLVSLPAVGLPNRSRFFVHSSTAAYRLPVLPWC
jgi:hypothetical protein